MRPVNWVIGLIGLHLVFWTAIPTLTHISLPLDIVREGLAWGHEWQWGYHKHPPLVSWIVEASFVAFGDWGPFLISQIAIALTYWCVFLLGRSLLDTERAAVGTLLLVGVYYFTLPTPEFNHNVAQMPAWAAALLCYHRAVTTGRAHWWAGLGLVIGVGLLIKYTIIVLALTLLLHAATGGHARRVFATFGPYLAIGLTVAVISPHLNWLLANDFLPFRYVEARAGEAAEVTARLTRPIGFLAAQLADHLPMLIPLAASGLVIWRRPLPANRPEAEHGTRRFLLILGLGPALLTVLLSLATGMGLRDMWGAPMWNLSGLLVVAYLSANRPRLNGKRLVVTCYALVAVLALAHGAETLLTGQWRGKPKRAGWPDQAVAEQMTENWRMVSDCPLRIIAGDGWLAGLAAMRARPRPSVFLDADPAKSPWITPDRLTAEGALVIWRVRGDGENAEETRLRQRLPALSPGQVAEFAWPRVSDAPPLKVGWAVLKPRDCGE